MNPPTNDNSIFSARISPIEMANLGMGSLKKGNDVPLPRRKSFASSFPKIAGVASLLLLLGILLNASVQTLSSPMTAYITDSTEVTESHIASRVSPADTLPAHAVATSPEEDPTIINGLEAFREFCLDPVSETACKNIRVIKPFTGTYGEWSMCWDNPPTADARGLAYTIGVGGNWDFEKTLASEHHDVNAFDCTVDLKPHQLVPGLTFEKTCLGGHTGHFLMPRGGKQVKFAIGTICDLVNRNKNYGRFMDVLKVDCEGCEWRAFERLFQGCPGLLGANIGQILIEMHMVKGTMVNDEEEYKRMLRVFASLKAHGFVPMWRHVTHGGLQNREFLPEVREALKLSPTQPGFMGYEMGLINTAPRQVPPSLESVSVHGK
eukprot:CAMPEP_0184649486 /NCGR_PEP_ID=MMETSP0308-20130426/6873_1 /TAXON_ID=38269 /ORGANISM="Gloeochaete witrockiana, Strain SAG 46.84" /LENGTH=377 /DNA_ID=CAMNT_0027082261 /DNA_START=27 /DNA_END=1160 /DNA_ORIENTATION=+